MYGCQSYAPYQASGRNRRLPRGFDDAGRTADSYAANVDNFGYRRLSLYPWHYLLLRQSTQSLDGTEYNLDSRNCKAEQLWNVTAEAGLKTLVWHWPGSAWPPSSDNPNLYVVDGSSPGAVNTSICTIDKEKILVADVKVMDVTFKAKAAQDSKVPCVIEDLKTDDLTFDVSKLAHSRESTKNIILSHADGEGAISDAPFDVVMSYIRPAQGWKVFRKGPKNLHCSIPAASFVGLH